MIRILTARPLAGHRLQLRFNDGLEGIFPVEPERRGGVFLKLLDARVFNAVAVILDRLDPIAAAGGFRLPRVCTPEELMGVSMYE